MNQAQEIRTLVKPTPADNAFPTHPRVHFNPIVSQLRYCHPKSHHQDQQDDYSLQPSIEPNNINSFRGEMRIDKNRNKSDMKNGSRIMHESSSPLNLGTCHLSVAEEEEEKVKKVLVTIAVVSVTPSRIFTFRNHNGIPQHPPTPQNVPDLLKTTPLFNRKHQRKGGQGKARSEIAKAGNSKEDLLSVDDISVYNHSNSSNLSLYEKYDDPSASVFDHNGLKNLPVKSSPPSSLWGWKTGLVEQLFSLRKRFARQKADTTTSSTQLLTTQTADDTNKNKDRKRHFKETSGTTQNSEVEEMENPGVTRNRLVSAELDERPDFGKTVENCPAGASLPFCDISNFAINTTPIFSSRHHNVQQNTSDRLDINKPGDLLHQPTARNCPEISSMFSNPTSPFAYAKFMDSFNEKDSADELSAVVDNILEEICGLENVIERRGVDDADKLFNCNTTMTPTPSTPSQKSTDDVISELVNECCSVSSALSCLTASANSLPITPTTTTTPPNSATTTVPEIFGIIRKPPLPPTSLRSKFFGISPSSLEDGLETGSRRLTPLKATYKLSQLDCKLTKVKAELFRSREEISRFHPNVEEIDNSVRSSMAIDRFGRNPPNRTTNSGWESSTSSLQLLHSGNSTNDHHLSRYDEENLAKHCNWNAIVTQAKEKLVVSSPSNSFSNNVGDCRKKFTGILETDLDTGASREVFKSDPHSCQSSETVVCSIDSARVVKSQNNLKSLPLSKFVLSRTHSIPKNLCTMSSTLLPVSSSDKEDRSRSMEFLMDDEKHAHLMPPENALQKNQENRQVSEHELRIQRSLQRLNVPDWYKNYVTPTTTPTSTNKTTNREFGSGLAGGWSGLSSSKTSSLTSLQSAGRYAGSKTGFSSTRPRGTTPTGGRSSRESLMSPSSTASASPSPYFERSSFTYGMPYALTRFSTRMSCGASPASLSPSPSPVGGITSSTSTPVSSGPMSRYGYNKTPYLGWRSQERLNSKTLYRSPSERLAADLMSHQKQKVSTPVSTTGSDVSTVTSPRKETASDLSLNISDTSESSNKLNRVRSSIKEVSNAIVDYVNETKPLDEGINGRASPRRGLIWLESSFVGTKPIDSPSTPDTAFMSRHLGAQGTAYLHSKRSSIKLDHNGDNIKDTTKSSENSQAFSTYLSRNEKTGEQSNSSSVSSPTLDDILDSLLALRRPHKPIRGKGHKNDKPSAKDMAVISPEIFPSATSALSSTKLYDIPASDWQQRMNQPLDDTIYFPQDVGSFTTPTTITTTSLTNTTGSNSNTAQSNNEIGSYMDALRESMGATSREAANPELGSDSEYGATTTADASPWLDNESKCYEERIAQEESNFGIPTEIPTPMPTLISNPLAGLNENSSSSNPTTPARHRRVSFDLDISDKDEKSSSRSKRDLESVGGSIQCKNSKCGKSATGLEARREFKTCHNCNAYYCSRDCRRIHWDKHKKVCMQSRVGQLCKQIISHVKEDSFVVSQLSTVAKRGFLAKGRGCVKLFFSSPDRAERFLTGGLPELPEPWYIPHADMLPEEMGAPTFSEISESCRTYNSETRFVLYVSVCVVNEVPTSGAVKWEREMISRCSKIRLLIPRSFDENQPHHHAAIPAHLNPEDIDPRAFSPTHHQSPINIGRTEECQDATVLPFGGGSCGDTETLILRSVPTLESLTLNSSDDRKRREISFTNIQKHLIERGVDLRRTYPDIYSKLCNYVENDEPFLPVTIYPRNSQTGSQFMCIIMPESSDSSYGLSSDPLRKVETINISE